MPPKNSTSVARKTHIPNAATSACWSMVAYWDSGRIISGPVSGIASCILGLRFRVVLIGRAGNGRRLVEVVLGRGRWGTPFQPGRGPRVGAGPLAPEQRPRQVEQRQHIA